MVALSSQVSMLLCKPGCSRCEPRSACDSTYLPPGMGIKRAERDLPPGLGSGYVACQYPLYRRWVHVAPTQSSDNGPMDQLSPMRDIECFESWRPAPSVRVPLSSRKHLEEYYNVRQEFAFTSREGGWCSHPWCEYPFAFLIITITLKVSDLNKTLLFSTLINKHELASARFRPVSRTAITSIVWLLPLVILHMLISLI